MSDHVKAAMVDNKPAARSGISGCDRLIAPSVGKSVRRAKRCSKLASFEDSEGRARAIVTPVRAIRLKCTDCCGGQVAEVRRCRIDDCPLWPYRMGRRPRLEDLNGREADHD